MRIGIHGQPEAVELAAAAEGVQALGAETVWRSISDYRQGEVEDFDAIIVSGMRGKGRTAVHDYSARGIPAFVLDYGYLRRVNRKADWLTGHWQFGGGGLNWIPSADLPDDRLRALGIALQPLAKRAPDAPVIVCGQHAGDPSHGLDAAGIAAWAAETVEWVRAATQRPILWRPHPDSPQIAAPNADGTSAEPFAEALDRAHCIVTIASNAGHEALIAGVPVICSGRAMYAEVACLATDHDDVIEDPYFPRPDALWRYLARLAYAQWTLDEIRTGTPIRFLLDAHAGVWPAAESPLEPVLAATDEPAREVPEDEPKAAAPAKRGKGRARRRS